MKNNGRNPNFPFSTFCAIILIFVRRFGMNVGIIGAGRIAGTLAGTMAEMKNHQRRH